MNIECSWCKEFIGEKEPLENEGVTSTICPTCQEKYIRKMDTKTRLYLTLATVDVTDQVGIDIVNATRKHVEEYKKEAFNKWGMW